MDDVNRGRTPAAMNETAAWSKFEHALTTYVTGMTDPNDHLDLEVLGQLCACLTATEDGQVQLALPDFDHHSIHSTDEGVAVARLAIGLIRDQMHLTHPHLMTINASGPQAGLRGMLCLEDSHAVPHEPGGPPPPLVVMPADRDELNAAISEMLTKKYGEDPVVDGDGDFVITHMEQPVWVHAFRDQPVVRIMARVAHGVRSRRHTAVELSLLNRDSAFVTWTLRDRDVWQQITLPATPFAPAHVDDMIDLFLDVMSETRNDLAWRLSGRVA